MGSALDDYAVVPPGAAPAPPLAPEVVVGAPEPGGKADYSRLPSMAAEPLAPGAAPVPGTSALDEYAVTPPTPPGPVAGDYGAGTAFVEKFVRDMPIIGQKVGEGVDWASAKIRAFNEGITEEEAAKKIAAEVAATEGAHPVASGAGSVTGGAVGLAAAAYAAPAAFGATATTALGAAGLGALTNVVIKEADNWMRDKPLTDPMDLGLTAAFGAGGGMVARWLQRTFTTAVVPKLEELARWGIQQGIPLQAGKVSANPLLRKLPGELLAKGETILPATGKAAQAADAELAGWHRAIARTIGSDAPEVTGKVLADARKIVEAENQRLMPLMRLPGGPPKAVAKQFDDLVERAKNIRVLEEVMSASRSGTFTPEEFAPAVQRGVDAFAKTHGTPTYAYDGGGDLGRLAEFGMTFLKGSPNARADSEGIVRLFKQVVATAIPTAVHYAHSGVTPAAILAGIIGTGKFAVSHLAGMAARSPNIARGLVGESMPLWMQVARPLIVKPTVGLAKRTLPGLIQQAKPLGEHYLSGFGGS